MKAPFVFVLFFCAALSLGLASPPSFTPAEYYRTLQDIARTPTLSERLPKLRAAGILLSPAAFKKANETEYASDRYFEDRTLAPITGYLYAWLQEDPAAAGAWMLQMPDWSHKMYFDLFETWVKKDPAAAQAFVAAHQDHLLHENLASALQCFVNPAQATFDLDHHKIRLVELGEASWYTTASYHSARSFWRVAETPGEESRAFLLQESDKHEGSKLSVIPSLAKLGYVADAEKVLQELIRTRPDLESLGTRSFYRGYGEYDPRAAVPQAAKTKNDEYLNEALSGAARADWDWTVQYLQDNSDDIWTGVIMALVLNRRDQDSSALLDRIGKLPKSWRPYALRYLPVYDIRDLETLEKFYRAIHWAAAEPLDPSLEDWPLRSAARSFLAAKARLDPSDAVQAYREIMAHPALSSPDLPSELIEASPSFAATAMLKQMEQDKKVGWDTWLESFSERLTDRDPSAGTAFLQQVKEKYPEQYVKAIEGWAPSMIQYKPQEVVDRIQKEFPAEQARDLLFKVAMMNSRLDLLTRADPQVALRFFRNLQEMNLSPKDAKSAVGRIAQSWTVYTRDTVQPTAWAETLPLDLRQYALEEIEKIRKRYLPPE